MRFRVPSKIRVGGEACEEAIQQRTPLPGRISASSAMTGIQDLSAAQCCLGEAPEIRRVNRVFKIPESKVPGDSNANIEPTAASGEGAAMVLKCRCVLICMEGWHQFC